MDFENLGKLFLTFLQLHKDIVFFLVLGIGYIIGNIRIGSFSLGSVAGVLFAGLIFGYYGFRINPAAQMVGFALFIFSVGYQAGPGFVTVLKQDGLKYFILAVVVGFTGFGIAALWAYMLSLPPGMSAGLLAGGLTSSPTLAAAQEAVHAGSVKFPDGWSQDQVVDNIAMGYAVTYIFGLVGLISMIKFLPKLLKIDLVKEAEAFESSKKESTDLPENVVLRTYRITDPDIKNLSLEALREQYWDKKSVVKVKRNEVFFSIDDEGLKAGDIIEVLGPRKYFTEKISKIGEEISPEWKGEDVQDTAQVVISNSDVIGHKISEIAIHRRFGLLLLELRRNG
jgi:putative transport protein